MSDYIKEKIIIEQDKVVNNRRFVMLRIRNLFMIGSCLACKEALSIINHVPGDAMYFASSYEANNAYNQLLMKSIIK